MTAKQEAQARLEDIVSLSQATTEKARAAQAAVQRILDKMTQPEERTE